MPKPLSVATVIEANRLSSDVPFICLIDLEVIDPVTGLVVQTERIANSPTDITFAGAVYAKGAFDIQISAEAGKAAEVSLTVNDLTGTVQSYMEAFGGGVGSNVVFYLVNGDKLDQPPEVVEKFQIISASASEYSQRFTLGAESTLMQTFPRRRQTRDFCQWRYKSGQCGYTGALATCDLTLQGPNGCRVHGREANYGGFPGISANGYRYG